MFSVTDNIVRLAKRAMGLHHPGRNLKVFPDDVFVLSYPKSGNTWTRFLIANLVYPEKKPDFSNINRLIPDPEALSDYLINRSPRPRLIKSHQYFEPRYPSVIYVVRDPRDVALSQYHFHRKRRLIEDGSSVELFVHHFVAGRTSPYASWAENIASWLATRQHRPGFLLLRYEDMVQNTALELTRVAEFLGIDASAERVGYAVAHSSAAEMRRLETQQAHLWSSTKDTRQDVPFVRAARPGGWKQGLSQAAVAEMENAWGPLMQYLGYELSTPLSWDAGTNLLQLLASGPRQ